VAMGRHRRMFHPGHPQSPQPAKLKQVDDPRGQDRHGPPARPGPGRFRADD
jgi:hypothetical protein